MVNTFIFILNTHLIKYKKKKQSDWKWCSSHIFLHFTQLFICFTIDFIY